MSTRDLQAALRFHKSGDLARAESGYRRVLMQDAAHADANYLLGLLLSGASRLTEASRHFERASASRAGFADADVQLALTRNALGDRAGALVGLFDSAAHHQSPAVRQALAGLLDGVALGSADDRVRAVLRELLEDPAINAGSVAGSVMGLLRSSAAFGVLHAVRTEPAIESHLLAPHVRDAAHAMMQDALLVAALPRMLVTDIEVERVLCWLRRFVLADSEACDGVRAPSSRTPPDFVAALAAACWNVEYAWEVTPVEQATADALRVGIERLLAAFGAPELLAPALALHALYAPLHLIAGWEGLSTRLQPRPEQSQVSGQSQPLQPPDASGARWRRAIAPIVTQQLDAHAEERRIAGEIPVLAMSGDNVSSLVREHYETHPYPRWIAAPAPAAMSLDVFRRSLRGAESAQTGNEVLVAGGGTGQQPIQLARNFPDARVLAIDLSASSLAYGSRMARAMGVRNVSFARADILALHGMTRRFGMVSCSGVLHHLADPMEGWRRLLEVLAPGGVMKIGLYSRLARRSVHAARALVHERGFAPDDDGIRRCRQAIVDLPTGHEARSVLGFADFYSLSGCRDLVMHAQERDYTVGELAECLRELGLRFLGFQLPAAVQAHFAERFPSHDAALDLVAWDAYEREHPNTFAAMYQFWCAREAETAGNGHRGRSAGS